MPALQTDEERLQSRRNTPTKEHSGTRSQSAYCHTTGISPKCGSWDDASNAEPQSVKRASRKIHEPWRPDQICDDGVSKFPAAEPTEHTGATKPQVSEITLQTDTCDTLYVNKDTLVAYTIAMVQNTQSLQYKQMQIALQMAQNQASIETPLRAEQLMMVHFNLAVLTEDTGSFKVANAQQPETAVEDPGLTASASDQETPPKTPYRNSSATKNTG